MTGTIASDDQGAPLIRDQVYQGLLDKLIGGELSPGDRITERVIAQAFGISTTPVKEALRRLENEGFVRSIPRSGIVVADSAMTSVEQVIIARAWLEGLAARLAADRLATGSSHQELDATLALMKKQVRRPVQRTVEINTRFHQAVREVSGNRVVGQFLGTLVGVDAAVRRRALSSEEELQRGNREHIQIGEAILAARPDEAEELMRAHVLRSGSHTMHARRSLGSHQ